MQGNWDVVSPQGLLLAYSAVGGLYQGLMPAISEAFNHSRLALTRYYVAQGFKYGGLFSAFVASALIGVGDRFILGALGEDYTRAAGLMLVMGLWGMMQFPAWFSDRFQEGTGRPDLQMWMLVMEQAIRIVLMFAVDAFVGINGIDPGLHRCSADQGCGGLVAQRAADHVLPHLLVANSGGAAVGWDGQLAPAAYAGQRNGGR